MMRLPLLLAAAAALLSGPPRSRVECFAPARRILQRQQRHSVRYERQSTDDAVLLRAAEMGAEAMGDGALGDENGGGGGGGGPNPYVAAPQRTLYDVLRCSPDATRAELKQSYVALARETHPDALVGRDDADASSAASPAAPDFNEVARAWRVLSDPRERRRYDRSLRADEITRNFEDAAERAARAAAPRVQRLFENVAVPLIRRTTATTVGAFEAARQDLNGTKRANIGNAFASAVRAGRSAGRAIDQLELLEKSAELERRADEEAEKAGRLRDELSALTDRRIDLALRTPDASLSSLEALKILDNFNTVDSVSLLESVVMLRRTLTAEIAALEEAEREYYEDFEEKAEAQRERRLGAAALEQAEANAAAAVEAERRAREALAAAQELVSSSRRAAAEAARSADALDAALRKAEADADRSGTALRRRQERVRRALLRKEEALRVERARIEQAEEWKNGGVPDPAEGYHFDASGMAHAASDALEPDAADRNKVEIAELQEQERYLTAESARLEDRANRLRSRSMKLATRVKELEKETLPLQE